MNRLVADSTTSIAAGALNNKDLNGVAIADPLSDIDRGPTVDHGYLNRRQCEVANALAANRR